MFALKQAAKPQKACVAPTKEQQREKRNHISLNHRQNEVSFFLISLFRPFAFCVDPRENDSFKAWGRGNSNRAEREALQVSHIHQLSFPTKSAVISYNKLCSVSINSFVQLRLEIFPVIKPTRPGCFGNRTLTHQSPEPWTSSDA